MSPINAYLWTVVGVLISFILPPLLRAAGVAQQGDPTASVSAFIPRNKAILTNRAVVVTTGNRGTLERSPRPIGAAVQ